MRTKYAIFKSWSQLKRDYGLSTAGDISCQYLFNRDWMKKNMQSKPVIFSEEINFPYFHNIRMDEKFNRDYHISQDMLVLMNGKRIL